MLKVLLSVLLYSQSNHALAGVDAHSVIQSLWLQRFGQNIDLSTVRLIPSDSLPAGVLARYSNNHIQVRKNLNKKEALQVLKHEYAHAGLDKFCMGKIKSPWLHESFAMWFSGDLLRTLNSSKQFMYVSSAEHWLKKFSHQRQKYPVQFNQALARLMLVEGRQSLWDRYFKNLIETCREQNFSSATSEQKLISHLKLPAEASKPNGVDLLVLEGLSKKVLLKKGRVDQALPVASHMKPLITSILPMTQTFVNSEDNVYWACPTREAALRKWSWQEALVKSCNGFYLNLKVSQLDWGQWLQFLKLVGASKEPLNIAESIGLVPGLKLSLRQLVSAYDLASQLQPHVMEVLKQTAKSGTLSASPAAQWFINRNIALKSGTLRNRKGVPLRSYVVALGPSHSSGEPQFIAVIHGLQQSSSALLVRLKRQLEDLHLAPDTPAKVQVLGLANYKEVLWRCETGPALIRSTARILWHKPSEWKGFEDHFHHSCAGGPIKLRFKNRKALQMTRDYFGSIYAEPESVLPKPQSKYPLNPRYFRARRGSALTLSTSKRNYLVELLSSEYPKGSMETLKALALVGLNNLNFPRHKNRPICDTTHCQVYGHGARLPRSYAQRISKAVHYILGQKKTVAKDWMPFSLGGTKPWTQGLSSSFIKQQLRLGFELESIKANKNLLRLMGQGLKKELPCETFRNQLRLKSCPYHFVKNKHMWVFKGKGEGHSLGMDLKMADSLSRQGKTYREILKHFF